MNVQECMIHSYGGSDYVSLPDAAEYLNITQPAISARLKTGTLWGIDYRGRKYVLLDDLLRLKERRESSK